MGWNFVSGRLGEQIMREIVDLVAPGEVQAVVGDVVGFDEIPVAITAMAERRTTGRTIVLVDADPDCLRGARADRATRAASAFPR